MVTHSIHRQPERPKQSRGKKRMSLRTRVLALSTATGILALAGSLYAGFGSGANAQTPPSPTAVVVVGGPQAVPLGRFFGSVTVAGAPAAAGSTVVASIG